MKRSLGNRTPPPGGGSLQRLRGENISPAQRAPWRYRILRQTAFALIILAIVALLRWVSVPPVNALSPIVFRALTESTDWTGLVNTMGEHIRTIPVFEEISVPVLSDETGESPTEFVSPVPGEVLSPFGWREDPGTGEMKFHSGVDLEAEERTNVVAAAPGRVERVWEDADYGLAVELQHGGDYSTLYAHLREVTVDEGDEVTSGDQIGESGQSGRASGPHLHFEVRVDDKPIDPLPFIRGEDK